MQEGHDGLCDVCREPPNTSRLFLDHDHKTGKVRGFLCRLCNTGLGAFRDSQTFLQNAAQYLAKQS